MRKRMILGLAGIVAIGLAGAARAGSTGAITFGGTTPGPFPATGYPPLQHVAPNQLLAGQHGTFGNSFGFRPLLHRVVPRRAPIEGPFASRMTERPLNARSPSREAHLVEVAREAAAAREQGARVLVLRPGLSDRVVILRP